MVVKRGLQTEKETHPRSKVLDSILRICNTFNVKIIILNPNCTLGSPRGFSKKLPMPAPSSWDSDLLQGWADSAIFVSSLGDSHMLAGWIFSGSGTVLSVLQGR